MTILKRKLSLPPYFLLIILFIVHIFFRFYNLEKWATFGWDQVDNAWAIIKILIDHKYPLIGMIAKENSGIYIGPLYYYLVAIFYFFTYLNPIASPIIAACTAIFSFWVIYLISKRLFNEKVALLSCFIYVFSSIIIRSERIQWPVNFIAPVSILIFYFLYRSITKDTKYLLTTAICVGLAFHVHFTSIFYPIIVLLALPLLPGNKKTLLFTLLGICIFFLFQIPTLWYYLIINKNAGGNFTQYFHWYYHGLHLRRVLQISHDAFIEFQAILELPYIFLRNAVFVYIPVFGYLYLRSKNNRNAWKLLYLICLWVIVPWLIFSTYSGELTDYYFSLQLYIAIIILAYITNWILDRKNLLLTVLIGIFWLYWAYVNTNAFLHTQDGNLISNSNIAKEAVRISKYINFTQGDPQSYLYFYYMYTQRHFLPYGR